MNLDRVGLRFRSKFKVVGGQHFYGQILDIPDTSRVSNFLSARRYLRTSPYTPIGPSMGIGTGTDQYIVGLHGDGFFRSPIYKHFKLFQVDMIVDWRRNTLTTNAITGVQEKSVDNFQSNIYISLQPKSDIEDGIGIQVPQHTIVTNAEINVDDLLNNKKWLVTKVDRMLGITLADVKER